MGGGEKFVQENRREFGIFETPEALAEGEAGVGVQHVAAAFERGCGLEGNRDVGIDRQARLARQQRDFIDREAVALDGQFMRLAARAARDARDRPAPARTLGRHFDGGHAAFVLHLAVEREFEIFEAAFLAGDAVVDGEPAAHDSEMIEHGDRAVAALGDVENLVEGAGRLLHQFYAGSRRRRAGRRRHARRVRQGEWFLDGLRRRIRRGRSGFAAGIDVERAVGQHAQCHVQLVDIDPRRLDPSGEQGQGIEHEIGLGGGKHAPAVGTPDREAFHRQGEAMLLTLDPQIRDGENIIGAQSVLQRRHQDRLHDGEIDPAQAQGDHADRQHDQRRHQGEGKPGARRPARSAKAPGRPGRRRLRKNVRLSRLDQWDRFPRRFLSPIRVVRSAARNVRPAGFPGEAARAAGEASQIDILQHYPARSDPR